MHEKVSVTNTMEAKYEGGEQKNVTAATKATETTQQEQKTEQSTAEQQQTLVWLQEHPQQLDKMGTLRTLRPDGLQSLIAVLKTEQQRQTTSERSKEINILLDLL